MGGGWDWGSTQGGEEEVGEESEEPSVSRWQVGDLGIFFYCFFGRAAALRTALITGLNESMPGHSNKTSGK